MSLQVSYLVAELDLLLWYLCSHTYCYLTDHSPIAYTWQVLCEHNNVCIAGSILLSIWRARWHFIFDKHRWFFRTRFNKHLPYSISYESMSLLFALVYLICDLYFFIFRSSHLIVTWSPIFNKCWHISLYKKSFSVISQYSGSKNRTKKKKWLRNQ